MAISKQKVMALEQETKRDTMQSAAAVTSLSAAKDSDMLQLRRHLEELEGRLQQSIASN